MGLPSMYHSLACYKRYCKSKRPSIYFFYILCTDAVSPLLFCIGKFPTKRMEVEKDANTNVTSVTKKPRLQIQNVVSTFFLGRKKLNLKKICPLLKYLEYNPNKFAAASMRIAYPRCTALVFNSGNIVCTGSKDEKSSRLACRQCVNVLQRSGLRVGFTKFKIQNIVGSCALEHPIDLIQMKKDYGPYTSYEPEL